MVVATDTYAAWLEQARIGENRLTSDQRPLLQAAFRFRQSRGSDYYSARLLGHFLLHCDCGLKVAQLARLIGISRPTASRQQGMSSKEAIQQAHHRLDGRPYGKLLPRYAGPIIEFLLGRPQARRADLIDFIDHTFGVRVSRMALYKFLKKFGIGQVTAAPATSAPAVSATPGAAALPANTPPAVTPATTPAPPLFVAPTQYAGAFLMPGPALTWLATARQCFNDPYGTLTRGLLTSAFALVVGLERVFHLDQMQDAGFARLTGGRRCPSRYRIAGWRRHLPWHEVDTFCRRTSPWHLIQGQSALVSYDEHTIPRWTHKFRIPKGYVTTRNKFMRCEKLFYGYDLASGRYLTVRATPGNWGLQDLAVPLTRQALERGQPEYLHALFDAGAGQSDAGVRALWELAHEYDPRLDVTLRACRYPHRVKVWKALPAENFEVLWESGPYVGAPAKEIRLAQTRTMLKDGNPEQAVRTILCREVVPGPTKDRWHPLFTTDLAAPVDVLTAFRGRQNHEQGYRVGVYDEFLDAVPCGYDKGSPDPKRPRFHRAPLQMLGWLVALVYNAVGDFAESLAGDYVGSHIRTLRRMFFNRPGALYETPEALVVHLEWFAGQEALTPVIDKFNAAGHRLPWLEDRRVIVSLTPDDQSRSGP